MIKMHANAETPLFDYKLFSVMFSSHPSIFDRVQYFKRLGVDDEVDGAAMDDPLMQDSPLEEVDPDQLV